MKHLLITMICLILTACGGGGEGDAVNENSNILGTSATTATTENETATETAVQTDTMTDLTISPTFDLSSKVLLYVDVDINMGNPRAYINICLKGEDNKADYSECLLRSSLVESKLNSDIMLANSAVELVAEIWFYDGQQEPMRYFWHFDASQESQRFAIR